MSYKAGLKLGIPIALGYFSVSMAYGLSAVVLGFRPLQAALISITNLTSAGQFAGTQIIAGHGTLAELMLTTLVINARYFLMALSLSQKLEKTTLKQRLIMAYGITDEIFAAAIGESGKLSFSFMTGLITLPVIGWTAGTWCGAAASSLLPPDVAGACGVAMYGMFIAILVPKARQDHTVALCIAIACFLSLTAWWLGISSGWSVILVTLFTAGFMAWLHPEAGTGDRDDGGGPAAAAGASAGGKAHRAGDRKEESHVLG